ncbi:metallophosphoesterase [Rhodanobacter ginsengiterrae]|uniref:metallophosphoesterase family protein n=1 Tax=Rhodanobacter ginsengiterrae TaxID=2008451 RepID=UPI003CEFA4BF
MDNDDQVIRWLHLSDFHVGKDDYATRKMFDYIIRHVRDKKNQGFIPDLLFITGDLADGGLDIQYETFWLDFICPLQQEIGGGVEQRTFVVPGNHDVDRTKHPAFSREEIAKAESHYLDPTDEGSRLRDEMLISRFRSYIKSDITSVNGAFAGPEGAYATCLTINDLEVGIVGINTAWLSKDNKDERRLTPGKPLLEKALNAIKPARLRIVLGHHPIEWIIPEQQKPIKSLLGQHHVLYLHGHLHDAWAEPTYGGGQAYLAIQAGAGFQSREGELWRNGLVWGEADLKAGEVRLQAWRWIHDQQAWTLATDALHESHHQGDWWRYPLPGDQPNKVDYTPSVRIVRPPKGWSVFKPNDLVVHFQPLDEGSALRYFDGAVPDWHTALSTSIPRRRIVGNLVGRFQQAETAGRPIVSLLLAAGCEGKTTALLQAASAIVEGKDDWRILQRRDESQPLVPDDILKILDGDFTWLLILDEADSAASELLDLLKLLPKGLNGRVHALLACRDTDWLVSNAKKLDWSTVTDFSSERLVGLDSIDALAIVQAWEAYGRSGLGNLADEPEFERAEILERQAKHEAASESGAFFGALLAVRSGSDLDEHARLLLERLGQRKISSGGNLGTAMAHIAAMHAEGLEYLSRPVLAQVLGCPEHRLHREILVPLGEEAAATTTSSFILTRHRRIAETLISVLRREFGEDIDALYIAMAGAAISAYAADSFVPKLHNWRFDISNHFLERGREELALNIAIAVLDREPQHPPTRIHLANLYRRAQLPEQALRVFRSITTLVEDFRGYYGEWGVCEGECGHPANGTLLQAFALADQYPASKVDNDSAKKILAGVGVSFGSLYDSYRDPAFRDARMAVASLGLTLSLDATAKSYFSTHMREATEQGAHPIEQDQAIPVLQVGIAAAELIGIDAQIIALLPKVGQMTFAGLKILTSHFGKTGKQRGRG